MKQEFKIYTELRPDGWYACAEFPQEEGGSIRECGPFAAEEEADSWCGDALDIVIKTMGKRVKSIKVDGMGEA